MPGVKYRIVTNNPSVYELYKDCCMFNEGSLRDVLVCVRDMCHKGYKLLSHPLSGSVKPNQTPYKSILVSSGIGKTDEESIIICEQSIETYDKMKPDTRFLNAEILEDFQLIDRTLIESALESAKTDFTA